MKKITLILITILIVFSFSGCGMLDSAIDLGLTTHYYGRLNIAEVSQIIDSKIENYIGIEENKEITIIYENDVEYTTSFSYENKNLVISSTLRYEDNTLTDNIIYDYIDNIIDNDEKLTKEYYEYFLENKDLTKDIKTENAIITCSMTVKTIQDEKILTFVLSSKV